MGWSQHNRFGGMDDKMVTLIKITLSEAQCWSTERYYTSPLNQTCTIQYLSKHLNQQNCAAAVGEEEQY